MNRIYLSLLLSLIYLSQPGYSQTKKGQGTTKGGGSGAQGKKYKVRWKAVPFDHQVFIANKGQFDGAVPGGDKILYGAQLGKVWAYFTTKGIVYQYAEFPEPEKGSANKDPDEDGPAKAVIHNLACNWVGSNASAAVETEGKQSYYYVYPTSTHSSVNTEIYKKITYKNIYPGIDIEYVFPKDKAGFKYSIIIHPGGDISKVKLNYPTLGALHVSESGDITFGSEAGEITDHAPMAGYEGGELESTTVSYQTEGNTESFKLSESYDKSKTIIIDPWVTDPLFAAPYDRAYDIDCDNRGNVYAYGSWMPEQLEKFNSNGAPQWIFNSTIFDVFAYYGDVVVNRTSGTSYITEGFNSSGARAMKLNTLGALLGTYPGTTTLNELWRGVYNACYNNIILGAGGTAASNQACMLDTNMVSITPVNVLSATTGLHDMVLIAPDPSGTTCYMATAQSAAYPNVFNNLVMQLPLPALFPPTYLVPDNFGFQESNVPSYVGPGSLTANGYNGMAASPNWLYIYNSLTLKRLNKSTGTLVDSIPINNMVLTDAKPNWGGLDVDPCDDIFVGCHDSIKVYNSSMTLDTSIVLTNTVYDVVLGENDQLYAGGQSFVCAVNVPPLASLISTVAGSPSSCSACNGTATVNINCGVPPFTFLWNDGSTNQVDTGLCAGVYRVKVTDGSCPPRFDSALISVGGKPGYGASVRDTNPGCILNLGNITVYPSGGTAPYTYSWTNGATTQEATGLSAGTYTCVITDNDGCKYFSVTTLVNPTPPDITIYPAEDSICIGSSVNITASGLKTYTWLPNSGLSCYNCPNPVATPTATTTYTITAVDSNGCTATTTATIKVSTPPKPIITGKDSICLGYRDTLSVTGGTTYLWSTGATTTTISGIIGGTETFTVTAYNGLCSHDTTFTVRVILSPTATIAALPDTVCVGDSALLTASGGTSYKWGNGSTTSSIWVVPSSTTTYTLEAFAGTCNGSTTKTVYINPATTATISKNDTICSKTTVTLTTTGSGGPVTYKWSTGATTSAINVSPDSTTTYTATVYGKCDTVKNTVKILVSPPPSPVITGMNWKCKGVKDTLTVSGGCTYKWNNGNTSTTYYTGPINADSTFIITVKNCLGCPVKDSFNVSVRTPETFSVTPAIVCPGDCIQLTTSLTSPSFSYKWSNGATTDTTTVCPDSTSIYNVTISNGCPATKSVTVQVYPPSLYACCDTTITSGGAAQLSANSSSTYKWYPPTGLSCDTCSHVTATPTVTTTYTVTGTNSHGCKDQTIITVIVDIPCFDFFVPNVFSPNGDGINETFEIRTQNLTGFSIYIYDRWGKEMFKTTNPDVWWNGLTEGGGKAPTGVYYYIIKASCQGNTYKKDGFLQLIR